MHASNGGSMKVQTQNEPEVKASYLAQVKSKHTAARKAAILSRCRLWGTAIQTTLEVIESDTNWE